MLDVTPALRVTRAIACQETMNGGPDADFAELLDNCSKLGISGVGE